MFSPVGRPLPSCSARSAERLSDRHVLFFLSYVLRCNINGARGRARARRPSRATRACVAQFIFSLVCPLASSLPRPHHLRGAREMRPIPNTFDLRPNPAPPACGSCRTVQCRRGVDSSTLALCMRPIHAVSGRCKWLLAAWSPNQHAPRLLRNILQYSVPVQLLGNAIPATLSSLSPLSHTAVYQSFSVYMCHA